MIYFALDGTVNETQVTYRGHIREPVRIGGGFVRNADRDLAEERMVIDEEANRWVERQQRMCHGGYRECEDKADQSLLEHCCRHLLGKLSTFNVIVRPQPIQSKSPMINTGNYRSTICHLNKLRGVCRLSTP